MCACSASLFGISLVITDELNAIYSAKMSGYDEDRDLSLMTALGVVGLMCGSLAADFIVVKGRRFTMLMVSPIAIIGGGLQLILNRYVIIAGKLIFGVAAGILITAASLYLSETIPVEKTKQYGFGINLGVTMGITIVVFSGFILPTDEAELETTDSWIYVALLPPIIAAITLLLWLVCVRVEPLEYCFKNEIKKDLKDAVLKNIESIYKIQTSTDTYDLYNEIKTNRERNMSLVENGPPKRKSTNVQHEDELRGSEEFSDAPSPRKLSQVSDKEEIEEPNALDVLRDSRFRNATLIGIMMACFN